METEKASDVELKRCLYVKEISVKENSPRGKEQHRGPHLEKSGTEDSPGKQRVYQKRKRAMKRIVIKPVKKRNTWMVWIRQGSRKDFLIGKLKESGNYEKIKHLFEILEDSFPSELKIFKNKTLPQAMKLVSDASLYNMGIRNEYGPHFHLKFIEKEVRSNLSLTLKESIRALKVTIIQHILRASKNSNKKPLFPLEFPARSLVVKNEIKSLTGTVPPFSGDDLFDILSSTGNCIINFRYTQKVMDLYNKATKFLLKHPEEYPDIAFMLLRI